MPALFYRARQSTGAFRTLMLLFGDGIPARSGLKAGATLRRRSSVRWYRPTQTKNRRTIEVMMKKILLGSVGLVALGVASAQAADLQARRAYTKAPVMVAAYDW